MVLILIQKIILVIAGIIAAITDLKEGLIHNWLTYPLIIFGIIISILNGTILIALVYAIIAFILLYALYWTGKLGGGDLKMFIGINFMMPLVNGIPTILIVFLIAGILALIFIPWDLIYKARKKIRLKENKENLLKGILLSMFLITYLIMLINLNAMLFYKMIIVWIALISTIPFIVFEKNIRKALFLKKVKLNELEEDEIIELNELPKKIQKKLNLKAKRILGKKEIKLLRKLNVSKVPVYRGMPQFGPFIAIAIIIIALFPELIQYFTGFITVI